MEPPDPNPYAPPEDRRSDAAIGLADLDLSRLKPEEAKILEAAYTKKNVSWYMALWQAFNKVLALVIAASSGKPLAGYWIVLVVVVSAGYLGLGYWARSWSRAGTLLLLGWHLLFNYHLLSAGSLRLKLGMLWIPAVVFLFGAMGAQAKVGLTRKAKKLTGQPVPVAKPRTFPAPVVRPGPATKQPEE